MKLILFWICTIAALAQPRKGLVVISIDGMRPDYVTAADEHHLKIPNLRRIAQSGAMANGVRGVLPTVTYPSHTTLMTGVWPSKHNIVNNVAFDPEGRNQDGWDWYFEDIHGITLWEAASKAGYQTGAVNWPVTVGARFINYVIPEFWRARTPDDAKLMRAVSTPGLIAEFEPKLGPYMNDTDQAVQSDWSRTRYAEQIIRAKHARFLTVHLAALDHIEHDTGPFSAESNNTLEEIDQMVGTLENAMHDEAGASAVAVVSDHGFARIDHRLNLNVAFVRAGLITPNPKRTSATAPAVISWKANAWAASASFLIVSRDGADSATRTTVEKLLRELAADPANGIEHILNRAEIAALGGGSAVDFWVDMKPGFAAGNALDGPLIREIKPGGTHGYAPTHPEMRASFLIAGDGIAKGKNLGDIDMRTIAPTLAKFLAVSLPSADLQLLPIF
jgi:predicted AlkP superfamily pyrophosphatase or phosphodiesterase